MVKSHSFIIIHVSQGAKYETSLDSSEATTGVVLRKRVFLKVSQNS